MFVLSPWICSDHEFLMKSKTESRKILRWNEWNRITKLKVRNLMYQKNS